VLEPLEGSFDFGALPAPAWARPGRLIHAPSESFTVNWFSMGAFVRARGALTAERGGFRRGQRSCPMRAGDVLFFTNHTVRALPGRLSGLGVP
jgi:hypothetical protein